jgi:hypothetical protein
MVQSAGGLKKRKQAKAPKSTRAVMSVAALTGRILERLTS